MSITRGALAALALQLLLVGPAGADPETALRIGSKTFSESYLLAEISAQLLEAHGIEVSRETGLGGTLIAFEALKSGAIDLYPEYTGTLIEAVLRQPGLSMDALRSTLAAQGLALGLMFGFDNNYAMAMDRERAQTLGIERIGDLAGHPQLRFSFSHEFLNRGDGWPALQAAYGLPQQPVGIEHALAYRAIAGGQADLTDAYTTDGELDLYSLRLLEDDLAFFPRYRAAMLIRSDLPPAALAALEGLAGSIDAATMRRLNRRVAGEGETVAAVAADFLADAGLVTAGSGPAPRSRVARILGHTLTHLQLTSLALLLACLVAVPASLALSRFPATARGLLYLTGLLQTVPALALLALLVPLVGLGMLPAVIALFLYSLLPIVRNTLTGVFGVDPLLKQVAAGMGLTATQQLLRIEVPLALPAILAGIKTAAIISIGTATLAAFVGAGGLGEPIITGLNLNDHRLILEGAIPAALLAITAELLFEGVERFTVPAHLRD